MGQKRMPSWNEKSTVDKILQIVQILLSGIVILLCVLQMTGVWTGAVHVVEPLMAVVMLIMSWQYRNYNKLMSMFCLAVAVFVTSAAVKIFFF
ncbi:MAG: hypothetical protein K2P76_03950 [Lachnospiraceae bacterium]|nr:hypothetical protein [Lachnospiraceae bacterium]MDE6980693.1 hypothetical protein [Lachnospiraceae bacterium]